MTQAHADRCASKPPAKGRTFSDWLRTELQASGLSQRGLARQSGVSHSTVSRLMRGERVPSLGTATQPARSLRARGMDAGSPPDVDRAAPPVTHPMARVEYALRSDEQLGDAEVRVVMEFYAAVRGRATLPPAAVRPTTRRP